MEPAEENKQDGVVYRRILIVIARMSIEKYTDCHGSIIIAADIDCLGGQVVTRSFTLLGHGQLYVHRRNGEYKQFNY